MSFWNAVRYVMEKADIIVLVRDARMPELTRNVEVEEKILKSGKPFINVFNKIDLISKEKVLQLKKNYGGAFFISVKKNEGVSKLRKYLMILGKSLKVKNPKLAVVGYPNVGKSALINILVRRAKAAVSSMAGTTKGPQWIKMGNILVLDSPGVIPFGDNSIKLGLIGAKNPEKIKNVDRVAYDILRHIRRENPAVFEQYVGNCEEEDALTIIARRKGFLKKGGEVDEKKAAIQVIRDWQRGRIKA